MSNPFDDPAFCRAYDYYVTVDAPGSWHAGYVDGLSGGDPDEEGHASERAYLEGYDRGRYEWSIS